MPHPRGSPRDCEWRGIIPRVIYIYSTGILELNCPYIPDDLDVRDTDSFGNWLSKDPGDYPGRPFHNALKLFLWIVDVAFHLDDDLPEPDLE
jgi:hypothetical protein